MKRIAVFICAIILIVSMSANHVEVFAKTVEEMKKEQEAIKNDAQKAKDALNQTKKQKNNEQAEMDFIDAQMNETSEQLETINNKLDETKLLLGETETDLAKAEKARDNQYQAFKTRSRYIYMNGTMSYIDVIFEAKSVTDLIKRVDYVNRIVEYDKGLVDKLNESEKLIAVKLQETQKQKDDLEVMELMATETMNKHEQARAEKESIIKTLEQDEAKYTEQSDKLDASSKEIEKLIIAAQAEAQRKAAALNLNVSYTYNNDGRSLQWPVPGRSRISSPYGTRSSPISGKTEFHTGIDIPAPYGSPIVAAESGVVIKSGVVNGYGNSVLIDHGNGMSTFYAHNSKNLVVVGETVTRGQVIAKCGSTGYSTGNHSHFEVRIAGKIQNPSNYVSP